MIFLNRWFLEGWKWVKMRERDIDIDGLGGKGMREQEIDRLIER